MCDLCNDTGMMYGFEGVDIPCIECSNTYDDEEELDLLRDGINDCQVRLYECNADHIECPLCGATESYLYGDGGRALTPLSMSSITHCEECPHTIINSLDINKPGVSKNFSCTDCRWRVSGGEFGNDTCENTSLSGHLDSGTLVCDDFYCNRWEAKLN